jgi:arabinogalactan endo-1,4-beta-galactosidase
VSFYPFYGTSATLANLQSSLTALTNQVGKPVMVAETDWPAACSGGPALSQPAIPASASGQQTWTTDIKNVLAALPNGRGVGLRACLVSRHRLARLTYSAVYWEPGWIGNAALGSGCSVSV